MVESKTEKPLNELNENNIKELEEKIENLKSDIEKQKDQFLRLAAEYDNYRKRSERNKLSIYDDATANAIVAILPIADCIEKAIESSSGADAEYKKGLSMLNDQITSSLLSLHIESFGNVGDKFDPEIHNAISHIQDEELDESVITQVFQKGYKLNNKIIRHAMVAVAN